jgi:hypothetical protein
MFSDGRGREQNKSPGCCHFGLFWPGVGCCISISRHYRIDDHCYDKLEEAAGFCIACEHRCCMRVKQPTHWCPQCRGMKLIYTDAAFEPAISLDMVDMPSFEMPAKIIS